MRILEKETFAPLKQLVLWDENAPWIDIENVRAQEKPRADVQGGKCHILADYRRAVSIILIVSSSSAEHEPDHFRKFRQIAPILKLK